MKLIQDLGYIYPSEKAKHKAKMAIYECPICKKEFKTSTKSVKRGLSTKCKRCSMLIIHSKRQPINKDLHRKISDMKTRCYNEKSKSYVYYGGRGVCICDEWRNDFKSFCDWALQNGYRKGLQIDRIDVNGNYEPSNCRFVEHYVNAQNKRKDNYSGCCLKKETQRWVSTITHNKKIYNLGTFNNKIDALIAYDLFIIKNKTFHKLNNVIKDDFNEKEWLLKIKKENDLRKISKSRKVSEEHLSLIRNSSKSAYSLAKELPYCKATILKIRNKKSYNC